MRIGVNALYLIPGRVGGTEIYLRNVLSALAQAGADHQYFVFRNRETGPDLTPALPNFHDCPQPVRGSSRPARLLYEQTALPWVCRKRRIQVLFNAGFTAPLLRPCPMVTVFHDLQYLRHPEYFRRWDLAAWRVMLPASAKRSQRIVVLSEAVKADLMRYYEFPSTRIALAPHGMEPEFARIAERRERNPRLPGAKTILSVSTLHPHKNLDTLLTAFARFRATHPDWQLCLAGLKGFETERIEAHRRHLGLGDSVTITGWLPRAELYALFEAAAAFVYPSKFEGFGIPVLEALAAGIPTACSKLPSLIEIADGAVRFFDPHRVEDIAQALHEITTDSAQRTRLREAGLRRARDFCWQRSAQALLQVFEEALQASTPSKNSQDWRAINGQR